VSTVVSTARHLPNLGWDPTPGDVVATGRVLYAWADELAAFQAETTRLEEDLGVALAELNARQAAAADDLAALDTPVERATRVWSAPPPLDPTSPIRPDLVNEPEYWTNPDLVAARAALDIVSALRQQAEDLHHRYVDQARVYARRIDQAGEDIPRNPAFWNGVGPATPLLPSGVPSTERGAFYRAGRLQSSGAPSVEQGVHEGLRLEGGEVVRSLAEAD